MALHDRIQKMRDEAITSGQQPIPATFQGVSKDQIAAVLAKIDRNFPDIVDAVFALLDNQHPSWFTRTLPDTPFCSGATTAHIGCHVGILQRGKGKLDREGRDYWLKPLWELGAIEKVYLDSSTKQFLPGHPVAKSSNSAYRLAPSFIDILKAPDGKWESMLSRWAQDDAIRTRLELQAKLAEETRANVDTKHSDLIRAAAKRYRELFLPGYEVIYIDATDGDRVTDQDKENLTRAGITLKLADAMPDVLLWNPKTDCLWVIEAVTSDGEVDTHKFKQLTKLASESGKKGIGFTTAYPTWRVAASRQSRHKNIHVETYVWIQEDPTKHFLASELPGQATDLT